MLRKRRHGEGGQRARPQDASQSNPLRTWARAFIEWTQSIGLSPYTARVRETGLDGFIRWVDERGIRHPGEVTRPVLQRYQRHLYLARTAKGQPLAFGTQITRLLPLVAFFKWLTREGHILANPAADLELPKASRQLPKHLLSIAQVEAVIAQPDIRSLPGLRDRAILETLYSSGIRRSELVHLRLHEVDTERGTLMVRLGKGRKDRLVPLGERACAWVNRYLLEVRPELLGPDTDTLFLTDYGEPFEKTRLSDLATRHMRAAGVAHGACHALRHAMATHMLEGGADIRYIQAMLGHANLANTQIYTHVAIGKLQAVHALTHPARLQRPPAGAGQAQTAPEGANAAAHSPRSASTPVDAQNLLEAALQADLVVEDED